MEEAENYYKDKVQLREWMQLDEDEEQIVALQARLDKAGKENTNPKGKKGKKDGKKGKKGDKKDDWAW
jgi:DNA-directed RNA polymerase delta subunit